MFGNPAWFRPKIVGWGLKPVTWQGWAYTLVWVGVILLPCLALLRWTLAPEAMIWLASSAGLLAFDVWQIRRAMIPPVAAATRPARQAQDGIWFVGEEPAVRPVATRNFDLQLKR